MMEVGVQSGGSLEMWRAYFGSQLYLYGIDINPYAKPLFENAPNTRIFVGDQENRTFWAHVRSQVPRIDVFLDDGGHSASQQRVTFEEMYDFVAQGGVYMIEDVLQTGSGTFLEFAKQQTDGVFGHRASSAPNSFTTSTLGVAFYDQQVVFEKGWHPMPPPAVMKGSFWMPYNDDGSLSAPGGGVNASRLQKFRSELTESTL
jgi:hypothetical protein